MSPLSDSLPHQTLPASDILKLKSVARERRHLGWRGARELTKDPQQLAQTPDTLV
jgi:hypothetical protein